MLAMSSSSHICDEEPRSTPSTNLDDAIRSLSSVLQISNADVGRQCVTTRQVFVVSCYASFCILDSERELPGILTFINNYVNHLPSQPSLFSSRRKEAR